MLIFCPIFRVKPSYLSVCKHSFPVVFDSFLPSFITVIMILTVDYVHVAPNFFRYRIVFIRKGHKTKRRRPLCRISQNRNSIIRNRVISYMLLIFIKPTFELYPVFYYWDISFCQISDESVNILVGIIQPCLIRVHDISESITTQQWQAYRMHQNCCRLHSGRPSESHVAYITVNFVNLVAQNELFRSLDVLNQNLVCISIKDVWFSRC